MVKKNTKEFGKIERKLLVPTVFWERYPLLNTWSKLYSTTTGSAEEVPNKNQTDKGNRNIKSANGAKHYVGLDGCLRPRSELSYTHWLVLKTEFPVIFLQPRMMYQHTIAGTSSHEERPDPNLTLNETLWNRIHTAPSHARSFYILRGHVSLITMGEGQPEQVELAKIGAAELCGAVTPVRPCS